MNRSDAPAQAQSWRPPTIFGSYRIRRLFYWGVVLYVIATVLTLNIDGRRVMAGFSRAGDIFARMLPPDFSRWSLIWNGMMESIQIAIISTVVGIVLAIPVGLAAARNLAPKPVYLAARGFIVVGRTFHEILIAIFFVKLFGFGPLAGVLTLAFGSTTFLAKTLAEDIENMKMGPIEALRATGASFGQIVSFGVMPQVLVKQIGIYIYRLDSNLRHSTIIGIVGAGGIGTTLSASFTKYDYDFASAILLCIAALVAMGEILSDWIRRRLR
ncbi:phosphonate ABC transporter, permease protein PhnE [Paracoccus sp. (in: a-proteobacteria)]|uniref:phosphonate ABC transporter, permease protein PhnE n=1 Tax=Paracoccus sp. TaxID=267 RepID=UPI002AFF2037|nr:phosphonate ABC transporter, permease protein PhnE [Paracoccus sp. (in: a-proteobacteria)]